MKARLGTGDGRPGWSKWEDSTPAPGDSIGVYEEMAESEYLSVGGGSREAEAGQGRSCSSPLGA